MRSSEPRESAHAHAPLDGATESASGPIRFAISGVPATAAERSPSVARQLGVVLAAAALLFAAVWLIDRTSSGNLTGGSGRTTDPAQLAEVSVGKSAPDFALTSLDGREVRLSDQLGKNVVLNFWATWCPPCRAELPDLDQFSREGGERGVVVYAINLQEDGASVREYVGGLGLQLNPLLDLDGAVTRTYRVTGLPTTVMIDRAGVIREIHVGALSRRALDQKLTLLGD